MLPEKLFTAIEIGEIKNEQTEPDAKSVRISIKDRSKKNLIKPISLLLSLSVSLMSIGCIGALFAANHTGWVRGAFDAMLRANFPFSSNAGIPVLAEPESAPHDTVAPPKEADSTDDVPKDSEDVTSHEPGPVTEPDSGKNETPDAPPKTSIYDFDFSAVPKGSFPIIPTDLSSPSLGRFYIANETPYNPDMEALSTPERLVSVWKDTNESKAPLVLIIHTHATEAYSEDGALWYEGDNIAPRTENTAKNVVAVGSVMAQVFRDNGIPTLHCTILHDKDSYRDSYNRAAETIKEYLAKYPSIKYVFDVHRDSLIHENGEKLRPITEVNGRIAAQVMCVVGTDYKGAPHQNWELNLSLAATLQTRLDESYAGLARHIYLRGASFNQQYTTGSLLIEIGSCGNSLEEAKYAAEITATELAQIIKGK